MTTYPNYVHQTLTRARDEGQWYCGQSTRRRCVSMCWRCSPIAMKQVIDTNPHGRGMPPVSIFVLNGTVLARRRKGATKRMG